VKGAEQQAGDHRRTGISAGRQRCQHARIRGRDGQWTCSRRNSCAHGGQCAAGRVDGIDRDVVRAIVRHIGELARGIHRDRLRRGARGDVTEPWRTS